MRHLLLYFLFLIYCFCPTPSYALTSDEVSVGSKSEAGRWISEKGGDGVCPTFAALDDDGWSVCYLFNQNASIVQKADSHCEAAFVEDPDICAYCSTGYMINDSNVCVKESCKEGCSSCYSPYMCREGKCKNGYYQDGWNCIKCDSSCATCSGSATYCTLCNTGYYKNNGTCSACPAGCKSCSSATKCTSCTTGYKLSSGQCVSTTGTGSSGTEPSTSTPTNTVHSCPPGLKKSSDGCCCIK